MAQTKYYIVSEMNRKVLHVCEANPCEGAKVVVYTKKCGYNANQLWYLDQCGVIHSVLNDMVLDSGACGMTIKLSKNQGLGRQRWHVQCKSIINDEGKCLDIKQSSQAEGAEVIPYPYNGTNNQHWFLEKFGC